MSSVELQAAQNPWGQALRGQERDILVPPHMINPDPDPRLTSAHDPSQPSRSNIRLATSWVPDQ
jgi:hypothetical protein